MKSDVANRIAAELGIRVGQVKSTIQLLQDGNTIPFIARYRKEATGTLNEIQLRAIEDALDKSNALAARMAAVLKSLKEQGVLTDDLRAKVESCLDLRSLEAVYLPFKPRRRTRAAIAREQGLQPLADLMLAQERIGQPRTVVLKKYIDPSKDLPDADAVLNGALDIVSETWADQADTRQWLYEQAFKFGKISSKVKRGKKTAEGADKFDQYFDRQESLGRVPGHRVLAMLRGSDEGILRVGIGIDDEREIRTLQRRLVTNRQFEFFSDLNDCVTDCYKRLLLPATESTILGQLKETAGDEAIAVFGKNLNDLLMAAPAGPKVTLGIDPGFRTGCKVAVVDKTGQFLANTTIYPTAPKNDVDGAGAKLIDLIKKHNVQLIAIGNGTASRETDGFVSDLLKKHKADLSSNGLSGIAKVTVSESGASIYSASDAAVKEFPDLDITVRGAISIARRLQDPLAELVKTDPKSIGVGQYQHDVNQTKLRKCLDRVVESCVNSVGVDLNMASAALLSHVAGIGPKLADKIIEHRNSNGRFENRKQLLKVPKLGKKAFLQAAGFLRIRGGQQPLDNSAVHPESYPVAERMAKALKADLDKIVGNSTLAEKLTPSEFVTAEVGLPTVEDIISELAKPGRDPRSEFKIVKFNDSVNDIKDLKPNQVLEGVITNVTHFGAFVDLGVHQDALIHISQLADEFVSDPNEVVSVGDVVKVKVMEVDIARKRIAATRKF